MDGLKSILEGAGLGHIIGGFSKNSGFIRRMMAENTVKHKGQYGNPTNLPEGSHMSKPVVFNYKKIANPSQNGTKTTGNPYGASPFIQKHFGTIERKPFVRKRGQPYPTEPFLKARRVKGQSPLVQAIVAALPQALAAAEEGEVVAEYAQPAPKSKYDVPQADINSFFGVAAAAQDPDALFEEYKQRASETKYFGLKPKEELVVREHMRNPQYSNKSIAERSGVSQSYAGTVIRQFKNRYDKVMKGIPIPPPGRPRPAAPAAKPPPHAQATKIQAAFRGKLARKKVSSLRESKKAAAAPKKVRDIRKEGLDAIDRSLAAMRTPEQAAEFELGEKFSSAMSKWMDERRKAIPYLFQEKADKQKLRDGISEYRGLAKGLKTIPGVKNTEDALTDALMEDYAKANPMPIYTGRKQGGMDNPAKRYRGDDDDDDESPERLGKRAAAAAFMSHNMRQKAEDARKAREAVREAARVAAEAEAAETERLRSKFINSALELIVYFMDERGLNADIVQKMILDQVPDDWARAILSSITHNGHRVFSIPHRPFPPGRPPANIFP